MALRCSTFQLRPQLVGNPGIEPGRHKGAGFTGPLSPQTWRYPDWLRERYSNARLVVMSHARRLVTAPVIPRKGAEAANASAAPAYVRPGAVVYGGEPRT